MSGKIIATFSFKPPPPQRRVMTKRCILVLVACFLLNFSILTAQNWKKMSDPVRSYVTRLDGDRLTCGRATQAEMKDIRELIDRITPSRSFGKRALAPPAASITVNYTGFTQEARDAFQRAVDIWSSLLIATVPIEIAASFGEIDSLGSASPAKFFKFKEGSFFHPAGLASMK